MDSGSDWKTSSRHPLGHRTQVTVINLPGGGVVAGGVGTLV